MEQAIQEMASSLTDNEPASSFFLDLPSELRNKIYYQALGNSTIHAYPTWGREYVEPRLLYLKPDWPFMGLVLTCKQVHNEASYILYQHGHFQIYMSAMLHSSIQCFDLPRNIRKRYGRHFDFIRNIHVDIGWLNPFDQSYPAYLPNRPRFPSGSIHDLCDAITGFRRLKAIRIRWLRYSTPLLGLQRARADTDSTLNVLEPFVQLQHKHPGLSIEIQIGQKMYRYEGGPSDSWDSSSTLEEYTAEALALMSRILKILVAKRAVLELTRSNGQEAIESPISLLRKELRR